ncbi:MAG: DUF2299 domain-containing protein [Candidatus Lokiarchaeota archaeon]|nr:DUF2299 domain-containing protein [Candidatus Lokiarchaeota archaeon]
MDANETKIQALIREYLLEEGLLRKKVKDPKIEFGFQFQFPPGPLSKVMFVIKPKNKDLIVITLGTQISKQHISALNSLEKKRKLEFFLELRKYFLLKDVFFRIDPNNHRFEISDQKFIEEKEELSKNSFFKSIRRVFNCAAYGNLLLDEYCSGKMKVSNLGEEDEFTSGTDYSLYS